mgnify:CR=1 FL=1
MSCNLAEVLDFISEHLERGEKFRLQKSKMDLAQVRLQRRHVVADPSLPPKCGFPSRTNVVAVTPRSAT